MKAKIYNLIRAYCVSDIAAENAAEKVEEFLKTKYGIVGHVGTDIVKILEEHPGTILIVNSNCTPKKDELTKEVYKLEAHLIQDLEPFIETGRHNHKRKSSREI